MKVGASSPAAAAAVSLVVKPLEAEIVVRIAMRMAVVVVAVGERCATKYSPDPELKEAAVYTVVYTIERRPAAATSAIAWRAVE